MLRAFRHKFIRSGLVLLVVLRPCTSMGDTVDAGRKEVLIGGIAQTSFEGINEFTSLSKYKKASAPVGDLEVKFSINRDGAPLKGFCTATIIDGQYILTARHCLHDE